MKWPQLLIDKGINILNEIHHENVEPNRDLVLRFFELDPSRIKVVILGQDPYPTPGVANGRAFAVNDGIKIPMSLKNIFKEIDEVVGLHKADRTLAHWEDQGVLLLNTSLTVQQYKPNSHKDIWKEFSNELISWLDSNLTLTWILWGNEAKKYQNMLNNKVVFDAHPSPLSVRHRKKNTFKEVKNIDW